MKKICKNAHIYYKSSDCPTCPICEAEKNKTLFFVTLSAPARRALERKGITSAKKLSAYSEQQIMALHGMGKASLPALTKVLTEAGLKFRKSVVN